MAQGDRMKLIEYPDRSALMAELATVLERDLADALARQDQVSFAVPGGTTPGPLFDALSMAKLDWGRVHIILTDERWVPQSDAQSNAALIRARLLTGKAAAAQFTPYFAATKDIDSAAQELSNTLKTLLPIDVLLLGMGADMHTASLFPDAHGLEDAMAPDAPMFMPIHTADQITPRFSLPALKSAHATHVLITGADKRAALARAQSLSALQAPIQTVLSDATVHWSVE
jgi:6-phosphogluconolactonase